MQIRVPLGADVDARVRDKVLLGGGGMIHVLKLTGHGYYVNILKTVELWTLGELYGMHIYVYTDRHTHTQARKN